MTEQDKAKFDWETWSRRAMEELNRKYQEAEEQGREIVDCGLNRRGPSRRRNRNQGKPECAIVHQSTALNAVIYNPDTGSRPESDESNNNNNPRGQVDNPPPATNPPAQPRG